MPKLECLIPAAGCSERMGEWKLALPLRGSTVIETVVEAALEACERVIVVSGFRAQDLESLLRGRSGVEVVRNEEWRRGMFSSIQTGIRCVRSARFFISLGDKPFISKAVFEALTAAEQAGELASDSAGESASAPPGATADFLFPVFQGLRGHPVLLSARVRDAVLEADPMTGSMKEIARGLSVAEIAWKDDTILRDIDTKEDYLKESST